MQTAEPQIPNYSLAVRATLLVLLDNHQGQWCSVAWLAGRTHLPQATVACYCQELVQDYGVKRGNVNGSLHFGVGCADGCLEVAA